LIGAKETCKKACAASIPARSSEAYEHWESVWLTAQGSEMTFLQALIQVAASFHHFHRGNRLGSISLLRSALRRLDTYPESFAGVALTPLRASIRLWLAALEPLPPLLRFHSSNSQNDVSRRRTER
jgi:predicted metal-dependent hydrolase